MFELIISNKKPFDFEKLLAIKAKQIFRSAKGLGNLLNVFIE